jgi:hypothetical protein
MKYKIKPPFGSNIVSKEVMTETELRAFVPQIMGDAEAAEVWKEKVAKDKIEDIIDWLRSAGYIVTEVEN